ncbi:hypothetical protein DFH06DRAFT_1315665 [Mycena polygramma]|nr:hypothetical protein DFH06DRAFT_1315665 [Mycena polygramma]
MAGYSEWTHGQFIRIRNHEAKHVTLLTSALHAAGANAVAACDLVTDIYSFVDLAGILSALLTYTGGAQFVTSKDNLIAAAARILALEARHEAWINTSSCPAANAESLPVLTVYPALTFPGPCPGHGNTTLAAEVAANAALPSLADYSALKFVGPRALRKPQLLHHAQWLAACAMWEAAEATFAFSATKPEVPNVACTWHSTARTPSDMVDPISSTSTSIAATTFIAKTGPEVIEQVTEGLSKVGPAFKRSHDRALFVLATLEAYHQVLTVEETDRLMDGFLEIIVTLNKIRAATLQTDEWKQAKAVENEAREKRRSMNLKHFKKLNEFYDIRVAAQESLTTSKRVYNMAEQTSIGARLKHHHGLRDERAAALALAAAQGGVPQGAQASTTSPTYPSHRSPATASEVSLACRGAFPPDVVFSHRPTNDLTADPVVPSTLERITETQSASALRVAKTQSTPDTTSLDQSTSDITSLEAEDAEEFEDLSELRLERLPTRRSVTSGMDVPQAAVELK